MVGEEPFYTSETEDEIFKRLDSSGVAEAVTDAVGDAVADLVRVKEYFEAVSLPVSFNIFLNVDDINEEGEYINGVRTLHDYVGVEFPLKNEYYYSWYIDEGYHSYGTLDKAKEERNLNEIIVKCIIPKGSVYYINDLDEIVASNIIVTDKIVS